MNQNFRKINRELKDKISEFENKNGDLRDFILYENEGRYFEKFGHWCRIWKRWPFRFIGIWKDNFVQERQQDIKRGDVFYADLSPVVGSEQGGCRPVLVIQNDVGNKFAPTVIVAAITSQLTKAKIPTHIELSAQEYNLPKDSVVLLEQIRTIDKKRLQEKITELNVYKMKQVEKAILISLGYYQK